ncbi:hypothetical protein PTTG_26121 [Puccinia triticina 1-1 BBBD Race 1]|uniref:Uncharacterized protein n=1 Tax=Puccinia triticina (isolate 1-1 / race 1 (BBBD)) TaxID=630390 RepID=A0A180GWV0_PUCT1|nr:hypothetical protein PTTG_26121 [Puccinia triticina 1-1 BBBD Race 1]
MYHEDKENHSDGESVVGDIQFNTKAVPRHDEMGFTPYFDKNIRELKGPIPLTIFNEAWKNRAILYYAEKRSKFEDSSSDRNRYTGYPYPSEWTQSFSDWTSNHQNFYLTLKVEYNFKRMANWLLAHKANADAILAEDGFMVALCYDIQVRTNAFAHCVALADGSQSVANILVFRSKIAHSCYATARKFDELDFTDNPYAENGTRAHWDPTTGAPKTEKKQAVAKASNVASTSGSASLPAKPTGSRAPKGSGYKGNNFDPNHAAKQSAQGMTKIAHEHPEQTLSEPPRQLLCAQEASKNETVAGPFNPNQHNALLPRWPTKVSCEMNIGAWEAALLEADLLPEFADVLDGFRNGFHQGIPKHSLGPNRAFFTPDNHALAWQVKDTIEEKL